MVVRAAPTDFLNVTGGGPAVVSFLGMVLPPGPSAPHPASIEYRTLRDASPVHHVSKGDPPSLLMHGDADEIVPIRHSELLESAFKLSGVPATLLRIPGGGHCPTFAGAKNPPDYLGEMVRWFDQHLKAR